MCYVHFSTGYYLHTTSTHLWHGLHDIVNALHRLLESLGNAASQSELVLVLHVRPDAIVRDEGTERAQ